MSKYSKFLQNYGKHPVTGQLVVVVHLALEELDVHVTSETYHIPTVHWTVPASYIYDKLDLFEFN